jgi:hypothetical protein
VAEAPNPATKALTLRGMLETVLSWLETDVHMNGPGPSGGRQMRVDDVRQALAAAGAVPDGITALIESLFVNGAGERANRLVLWDDSGNGGFGRDLGGWGYRVVKDKIEDAFRAALAARSGRRPTKGRR